MTDITKGNVSIIMTMKAPTEEGADVCRNFLEGHREMMETKSHLNGVLIPLKVLNILMRKRTN